MVGRNFLKKDFSKIIEPIFAICLFVVLVVMLWIHMDANVAHYNTQMDPDIASEALLGKVIAENGFRLSDTWYSSTGVRVISAPNLAALIYPIVGNDMNLAAGIACSVYMLVLVAVMYAYLRRIGFSGLESLCALVLLFSLSDIYDENQSMLFCWASYYVSHFVTLFLVLIFYDQSLKKGKVRIPVFVIFIMLAFVNGLQGMHAMLYCYLPLLGVEILRRLFLLISREKSWRENLSVLVWTFILAVSSFLGTKVYSSMGTSRNIRHAAEKFKDQVWPALTGVVYVGMNPVLVTLLCVLAVAGFGMAVYKIIVGRGKVCAAEGAAAREDAVVSADIGVGADAAAGTGESGETSLWSTLSLVASLVLWIILGTFTTTEVAPRYFIMLLFIVAVGVALFMKLLDRRYTVFVAAPVLVLGLIAARYYYDGLIVNDETLSRDEYRAAEWMEQNGYEYGYATFDFANTITVMSNERIHVRALNSMEKLDACKWLTDSKWYPPVKSAEGETCYIVTKYTEADLQAFIEAHSPTVVRTEQIGIFTIYVFDHDYSSFE